MEVNINRVLDILDELNKINEAKLEDITWIKDDHEIVVNQEMIDNFEFIGLNNVGFITHEYYIDNTEEN